MGDKLRYMQILLNFLTNAVKFTRVGQFIETRVILLEVQEIDDSDISDKLGIANFMKKSKQKTDESYECYVKFAIEIEDSGVGIKPENLKSIFIDFMKLKEHSKMNPNGTGLGLSICKHIVEKMGGKIKVNSVPNIGTTFRVLISTKVKLSKEPEFLNKKI